jgi:heterotetrameric sarcosine oxidase gamma subunit
VASPPRFESAVPVLPDPPESALVWVVDESTQSKVLIKAAPDAPVVAQLAVPFGASRRYSTDVLVAGTRPSEWMLLGSSGPVAAVMAELDPSGHTAVVDYTHGRGQVRVVGPKAAATLEKLCSTDFSDQMLPDGAVVGARVAEVICDIVRQDVKAYEDATLSAYVLIFDRSYGEFLATALFDAVAEFLA